MQFSRTISTLFSSILLVFSLAGAVPVDEQHRSVTLPITPYKHEARNIPAQIRAEQLVNRGLRRLARMSGGAEPPEDLLERNLMRRVLSVEGPEGLERRFNRRTLDDTVNLEKRYNRYGIPAKATAKAPGKTLATGLELASKDPVTPAETPSAPNSLGLSIESTDVSYLATVQIGTPARDFSLVMDSGSADFWVGSESCKSTSRGGCGDHVFLGPKSSQSFVNTNRNWSVKYGTGSVSGTIVKDTLVVAGLSLPGHTFGVANLESQEFTNAVAFDGLMGLARSSLSNQTALTPVEALASAGLIEAAIVSYKLGRTRDNNNDGQITFGGLDSSKFNGSTLVTVPNVNRQGFWGAQVTEVTVNGKSVGLKGRTAVLDTGTNLAILPTADAKVIHNQIPGSRFDGDSQFTIPCTTTAVVSLTFGGRAFSIDSRDLALIPIDGDFSSGDCISGILAGTYGSDLNRWLVGDTFLKNVYYSTDVGKNTISLAKLA